MTNLVDGLDWLPNHFQQGFSVTFARGVQPRDLLVRMGCPEESLAEMTREEAEEVDMDEDVRVIRAGFLNDWGYAVQSWDAHILGEEGELMARVSEGTEVVVLVSTATVPWFAYCADGRLVCSFDPGTPLGRYGDEPDRFLAAMERSGVLVDSPDEEHQPVAAMLRMAEAEFGLALPVEDIVRGELLAGQVV
ncbi:DUF6461 domain-containing protein [Kitasatospora sp. MMS16-BH015]|uniref:DUF6461 domain-containing protein n=1 Tax=Kitasatospora sp. MMS16-BH015 TaxID=2018025 RepID=UPI000CF2661F|nr:DUF6461 domain-containing protein [Kitasatospora sp. MMS16-BH015]